jgi:hypothetical protein
VSLDVNALLLATVSTEQSISGPVAASFKTGCEKAAPERTPATNKNGVMANFFMSTPRAKARRETSSATSKTQDLDNLGPKL